MDTNVIKNECGTEVIGFEELLEKINQNPDWEMSEKKEYIDGLSRKCKDDLYNSFSKKDDNNDLTKLESDFYNLIIEEWMLYVLG